MIAKPGWFVRRKYLGWGFFPRTWQAWVYLAAVVGSIFLIQSLPFAEEHQLVAIVLEAAIVIFFFIDIFRSFRQDERETVHEALAERNAMWAMVSVLALGLAYRLAQNGGDIRQVDPVIGIAIAAALIVKAITNIYLERKD
jgi:hypothetical protein